MSTSMDARDFGFVADANPDSAGINATALNAATKAASAEFGSGFDTGGGGGARLEVPRGTAYLGDTTVIHDGVEIVGHGTYGTVLRMASSFVSSKNFFRLGTPGSKTAVCASQTMGAAGALAINGDLAVSGVAEFIQKRIVAIYSSGNNSGVNFTMTGVDGYGGPSTIVIAGPNNGFVQTNTFLKSVSSIVCDKPTVGAVSVGMETVASFGSKLSSVQLWSSNVGAAANAAMLYSDNAQHTAGAFGVKLFAGSRVAVFLEKGIGGASYLQLEDIETFNFGNIDGTNNPQILLNYAGLLVRARKIVCAGPGANIGGSSARGIVHLGGHLDLKTFHPEGVYTGMLISIPTVNEGSVTVSHAIGNSGTPIMFHLDGNVDLNTVLLGRIFSNGSATTVRSDPANLTVTGNILRDRWF